MNTQRLEELLRDARYALRQLCRSPLFAITLIGLLAVGIGANTTVFSIVNSVLIEPLPYKAPERLVRIWESNPKRGLLEFSVSVPNFHDWQAQQSAFESLSAAEMATFNLTSGNGPERVAAAAITSNLIPTLSVSPYMGRNFLPEEEQSGRNRVALISYGLWQRQFGGDPLLLNKTIELNRENYTIVGIMPAGFQFPATRDLWVPLILDPTREPWRADRTNRNLWIFGRLRAGKTVEQASAEMGALATHLEQLYPQSNEGWGVRLRTFKEWLVPATAKRAILALFAAVGLMLFIVCANVAGLLLVRAKSRLNELTLRVALGASSKRIVQQLAVETMIMAILGGGLGLVLAFAGTKLIMSEVPRNAAFLTQPKIDGHVLVFTLLTALATGFIFGLAPAKWAIKLSLVEKLNQGGRNSRSQITKGLANSLVVTEVSLALMLLVSSGLMLRSFVNLQKVQLGFVPENVLTTQISLPASTYAGAQRANFYSEAILQLQTVPGIMDAAAVTQLPLSENAWAMDITLDGASANGTPSSADAAAITSDYFKVLGIPLLQGREFTDDDGDNKDMLSLIVSESFARFYWPNQNPIGKRFRPGKTNPFGTVVGVVGDVRNKLQEEIRPAFYFPHRYIGTPAMVVLVRTAAQPENFAKEVRARIRSIDPGLPIYNTRTMREVISNVNAQPRFEAELLTLFSTIALILAAIGIYGQMAYMVAQRSRDIGIMMALGANARGIRNMVLKQGMKPVVIGVILGLFGCFMITRLVKNLLFGISASDPFTFVTAAPLLTTVAFVACYLPALKATRVDPSTSLRTE